MDGDGEMHLCNDVFVCFTLVDDRIIMSSNP